MKCPKVIKRNEKTLVCKSEIVCNIACLLMYFLYYCFLVSSSERDDIGSSFNITVKIGTQTRINLGEVSAGGPSTAFLVPIVCVVVKVFQQFFLFDF